MSLNSNKKILPCSLHFVGVGGIGMSGLAQMALALGTKVSGSDRALESPENAGIVNSLRAQGVSLYPQDGSRYLDSPPDAIVYSTAIEEDNPDFKCAANVPRIHRSEALSLAINSLNGRNIFAVSGTCGKTTVSAWLAEALQNAGASPGFLCGGLLNGFAKNNLAGNFSFGGDGDFVIEADESDKSLLNYAADSTLILNIGTDHYPKEELACVFREFILKTRRFTVMEDNAFLEIGPDSLKGADIILFSTDFNSPAELHGRQIVKLDSYRISDGRAVCSFDGQEEIALPAPGIHNAANALAVYVSLLKLGYSHVNSCRAVAGFRGVWRRFDYAGKTRHGAMVYDDYAHNVEKIVSCIKAATELSDGRILAFFQPHGFGPLKFMRSELFNALEQTLRTGDIFALMPVYYVGGSTSFSPTSEDVAEEYRRQSNNRERYLNFEDRAQAEFFIRDNSSEKDIVLIMGARDNSLSDWALKLTF